MTARLADRMRHGPEREEPRSPTRLAASHPPSTGRRGAITATRLLHPTSVEEAVGLLEEEPAESRVLAGATWLMRAAKRGEALPERLVSTSRIAALRRVENGPTLTVGAGVTHAELAARTAGERRLHGLHDAAATSANPAVRSMATVGGNLGAVSFPAADLVPALLAAAAAVIVAGDGAAEQSIDGFLGRRPAPAPLITDVRVPSWFDASAHARLTLRAAGDYPVAIVSVALSASADRVVEDVRVAVGSLEPTATRWTALEAVLKGTPVDAGAAHAAARDLCANLAARDGVEAPAWYRREVVPNLVRQAMQSVSEDLAQEPG